MQGSIKLVVVAHGCKAMLQSDFDLKHPLVGFMRLALMLFIARFVIVFHAIVKI